MKQLAVSQQMVNGSGRVRDAWGIEWCCELSGEKS
jgi:hypothetical protein